MDFFHSFTKNHCLGNINVLVNLRESVSKQLVHVSSTHSSLLFHLQEAMMDHPLQMISYIADIGSIVVLMARRKPAGGRKGQEGNLAGVNSPGPQKKCCMICHVFNSDEVSHSSRNRTALCPIGFLWGFFVVENNQIRLNCLKNIYIFFFIPSASLFLQYLSHQYLPSK